MPRRISRAVALGYRRAMTRLDEWLYPQLRAFPHSEREKALREARAGSFDVVELVGIAIGLIVATALTRYTAAGWTSFERLAAIVLNFGLAAPLVAVGVGPFLVRHVRRGLERQIAERSGQ